MTIMLIVIISYTISVYNPPVSFAALCTRGPKITNFVNVQKLQRRALQLFIYTPPADETKTVTAAIHAAAVIISHITGIQRLPFRFIAHTNAAIGPIGMNVTIISRNIATLIAPHRAISTAAAHISNMRRKPLQGFVKPRSFSRSLQHRTSGRY